jgi:hypothetical protein
MRTEAPPTTTGLFVFARSMRCRSNRVPNLDSTAAFLSMKQEDQMPPVSNPFATPLDLYRAISRVWSGDTSSPTNAWSPSNPAQNHCSVTSLVVQDYFGGDILTTQTLGGTHFYNRIDGKMWDLTVSQFAEPVPYGDSPSTREAALADTSPEKYALLVSRLNASR